MLKHKYRIPQRIREAMDSFPGGLSFSMPDGRPILVNRQMNRLSETLTGHTVLDAESLWSELWGQTPAGGCRRLDKPWAESAERKQEGILGFALEDGTTWQFHRDILREGEQTYVQIEAADITELYRLSQELYENNRRLQELQERQRNLLANIVQINREKELVSIKMKVHDDLGQCLLATSKALREGTAATDSAALAKSWKNAVQGLTNIPLEDTGDAHQEAELMQVAGMIGCSIEFTGERPADRKALRLLYAAVREALTNAVRHAGADRLSVSVSESAEAYHVEISDNGHGTAGPISEGDGLRNLRKRLEQEGAAMNISYKNGVVLVLDLPHGRRKEGGSETW